MGEEDKNTKKVKTIIVVECEGDSIRRVVHERWWKKMSLEEIADTIEKAVKEIV